MIRKLETLKLKQKRKKEVISRFLFNGGGSRRLQASICIHMTWDSTACSHSLACYVLGSLSSSPADHSLLKSPQDFFAIRSCPHGFSSHRTTATKNKKDIRLDVFFIFMAEDMGLEPTGLLHLT